VTSTPELLRSLGRTAVALKLAVDSLRKDHRGTARHLRQLRKTSDALAGLRFDQSGSATVNTSLTPLLSIQKKSGAGKGKLVPCMVSVHLAGNQAIELRVLKNASLTGPSWVDVDAESSLAEYDTTATALTGGTVMLVAKLGKADSLTHPLLGTRLQDELGDGEGYTIAAVTATGSTTVSCVTVWSEET
jgi:hypothetical protein